MANAGPDTNKAQVGHEPSHVQTGEASNQITDLIKFFITYAKQTSLDGKYSIFGK